MLVFPPELIVVIHVTALTGLCFQIVLVFRFVMCGWFRFLDIVEGERVGFPLRSCGLSRCFDCGRVNALVSRYGLVAYPVALTAVG